MSAFVVDLHVHGPRFVPQPFRSLWRITNPRRPRDEGFDVLRRASVDLAVAKAVGDPIVTRWYLARSAWDAVDAQLALIEQQAADAGVRVVTSAAEAVASRAEGVPAVMLGVEGADALTCSGGARVDGVDGVDRWYERGVRVVVLVHLRDNAIGTTCLPWQQYAGPVPVRRKHEPGLSAFGVEVVARMNRLGMLIDVAHADRATLLGVVDAASAPVVSSHSGARAIQDFPRYLTDDELRAIAGTGGVVGLWPFRTRRYGVRDVAALVTHARHIADTVGVDHVCVGTDMNGVPGLMAGYQGEPDLLVVGAALRDAGFSAIEVDGILGANALRVLEALA